MKIAIFHNLPSGGAKRVALEQVQKLHLKHQIDVYSFSSADQGFCDLRPYVLNNFIIELRQLPLYSTPFGRLNQLQRWRMLNRIEILSKKLALTIDQKKYDIVLAYPCMFTQAPTILKYIHVPSLYYIHEPLRRMYEPEISRPYIHKSFRKQVDKFDPLKNLYQLKLVSMDRQCTNKATLVVANSKYTAANVMKIYGRHADVLYPGIDIDKFRPVQIKNKENFILSVGALGPNKGFDFLITALSKLQADIRPSLYLIGNNYNKDEFDYLLKLAKEHSVDLKIETKITDDQLVRRYNQAKMVVYSPVREPLGLVPLEAQACGTPVIGINEGGIPETIMNQKTGILVERDPELFAQKVKKLLFDTQLADNYGKNGRAHVIQNWTWEKSVQMLELYLEKTLL